MVDYVTELLTKEQERRKALPKSFFSFLNSFSNIQSAMQATTHIKKRTRKDWIASYLGIA